jgi:hypothetical protein
LAQSQVLSHSKIQRAPFFSCLMNHEDSFPVSFAFRSLFKTLTRALHAQNIKVHYGFIGTCVRVQGTDVGMVGSAYSIWNRSLLLPDHLSDPNVGCFQ